MTGRPGSDRSPADQLLLSARELRLDERFTEAVATVERAAALSPPEETARLIRAEQARLAYYFGDFQRGVRLAAEVADERNDLAAARAGLALSVNLLALNRARDARAAATTAQLRFRSARASGDELADGLIQLAHVEAHIGNPRAAIDTARAATRITAGDPAAQRVHGRALCALGFVLTYAGDHEALDSLLEAERIERPRGSSLWHWIQFCIAVFLRDRGYQQAASVWLARSGIALRHERGWFALRDGDPHGAGTWLRPPVPADDRPFVRSLVAATRAARGMQHVARTALTAATEFDRLGMQHWSWGARWIAAADNTLVLSARADIVGGIVRELEDRSSIHWAFFDPKAALAVLRSCERYGLGSYAQRVIHHLTAWSTPAQYTDSALLGALSMLSVDALASFADVGLTPAEIRALSLALELWLQTGEVSRRALSERLGLQETSTRSVMGDIRAKLGITGRRGIEPIVSWLAERDLLGPSTATRVVRRLTAAGPGASRRPGSPAGEATRSPTDGPRTPR